MDKALVMLLLLLPGSVCGQILAPILTGGGNGPPAIGAITAFNHYQPTLNSNTVSVTAATGATLVAFIDINVGGTGCGAITVSWSGASTSFTQIGSLQSQNFDCAGYAYAKNVTGGSLSIVANLSAPETTTVVVYNVSGANATSPLAASNAINTIAGASASLTISGSSGRAMICSVTNYYGNPNNYVAGNPSGMVAPVAGNVTNGNGGTNIYSEYLILSGSASACTMTSSGTQFQGNMMGVAITP